MSYKHYAFVERKYHSCNGTGELPLGRICVTCNGTGMCGSYERVSKIQFNGDKEYGALLHKSRERRMISMSELAALLKCKISRISEIEMGLKMPADKEREKLEAWINE